MAGEPLSALLGAADGQRPALICPDDESVLTHAQLGGEVERLASSLAGLGVRRGDRVAMLLASGPEPVELLLAAALVGAAAAPINPAYTETELRFFLADLKPRLLLVPAGEGAAARAAAGAVQLVDLHIRTGAGPRLEGPGAGASDRAEVGAAEDVALLLHTSGTTSRPKQVPLLQRNLMAVARAIGAHYRLGEDDVSYCAMPLFHVHGLVGSTLSQLAAGGAVVTQRRFAPGRFADQCTRYGVSWCSAGPTFHQSILERSRQAPAGLRFLRSCSSALPAELAARCEQAYAAPMLEAYGMTEASHQMTSAPLPPGPRPAGSVGVPAGAQVRILDGDWKDVAPGAAGEVCVSGPGLTPGYLENPSANAESFRAGWFRTGDEGELREGQLYLRGRIKEMIIRGGENIAPAEIEQALRGHPAVLEAVSFGLADERYGQVVGAAVVASAAVAERELQDFCRESLAAFKVPARIAVVDQLPRTATGKLQRRLVAQALFPEEIGSK
jgi:acyl-CoA synthetase (AMP-forming)/AMP-acid ligase II